MSYIRWSTRLPGQKNVSRIYSWYDVHGGIVVLGRPFGNDPGGVLFSHPEALYWARNIINGLMRYQRKGETLERTAARLWRAEGFFKKFDAEHERQVKKRVKEWDRLYKKGLRENARRLKELLKSASKKRQRLPRTLIHNIETAKELLERSGFKLTPPSAKKGRGK